MKILIVKTSAIGDVIHTLPALNCLRDSYPQARIDWLVEEAAAAALVGHRAVNRVLISRRKQWIGLLRGGRWRQSWRGLVDLIRQLRAVEYDLVIDFQGLLKSGVFVALAKGTRKAGFGRGMAHSEASWLFLNERVPPVSMDQHALVRGLQLLAGLHVPCQRIVYDFPVGEGDRAEAAALLDGRAMAGKRPLVAINAITTWPTKHWVNERFAQVADRLLDMGADVIFTGGPADRERVSEICAAMAGEGVNLAGRTSLKVLAALFERARLVVTIDSGPMHLAAAMGTPVLAIFGPTAPWRTGPFGAGHTVLRVEMECSPCLKRQCRYHHECMEQVSVDQVVEAARWMLDNHG